MSESNFKRKTKVIDDEEAEKENLEQVKKSHQVLDKSESESKIKNGTGNSLNRKFI